MNRLFLYILYVCLLGLGMSACTGEEIREKPVKTEPAPETLHVKIPVTRAVNDANPENAIRTARLIVVDKYTRKIIVNKDTIVAGLNTNAQIVFNELVFVGTVDWYIICNELTSWGFGTSAYNKGNTIDVATTIDNKILSFANSNDLQFDGSAKLIPMVGIYKGLEIRATAPHFWWGSAQVDPGWVKRLIAKVKLQIDCTYLTDLLNNGGTPIDITGLSVKRMPKESWILPKVFTGPFPGNLFDGANLPLTYPRYTSNALGFHYLDSFYIPEYHPQDTGYYSYISAKMNLRAGASAATEKEYRLVIGNGMEPKTNAQLLGPTKTGNDVVIDRNTCYNFIITVVSYEHGGDQDLVIRPTVVNWDESILLDTIDIGDNNLLVSPGSFTLPSSTPSPYKGVIDIYTDYQHGWTASAATTGGATIVLDPPHTNQPSGKLKFTFTGTVGTATITIKTGKNDKLTKVVTITRL
ncbi:hypothetical protein FACS1894181_08300 [Bacteroidia bacterium]|nr:hypothetical protein FACS1894181_08300 [Bacteroidia bacterium]